MEIVVGFSPVHQGVPPAARAAGGARRRVRFVMGHPEALVEHGVAGPLSDQAPASARTLLLTGQSAGATSGAGRRQRRPAE